MPAYPLTCLSACPLICLSVHLHICLSAYLSICLSVCSIGLPAYLHICPLAYPFTCLSGVETVNALGRGTKLIWRTQESGNRESLGRNEEFQHNTTKFGQNAFDLNCRQPERERRHGPACFRKSGNRRLNSWRRRAGGGGQPSRRKSGNRPKSEGGFVQVFRGNDGQVRSVPGPKRL